MTDYYIVSINHTRRENRYILLWRPDDKGYTFRTSTAGLYPEELVLSHLGYYNAGCAAVAVRADVMDQLTVLTTLRDQLDGDDGPALLNTKGTWDAIKANLIRPTKYQIHAEYKGAPRRKEVA